MKFLYLNLDEKWRGVAECIAYLQWQWTFVFMGPTCLVLYLYTLLFTRLWWLALIYGIWQYNDIQTPKQGGRRNNYARHWEIWKHVARYFPLKLIKTQDLDPRRNYIFVYHPHGVFSVSAFIHFATEGTGFSDIFPGLKPILLTLSGHFQFPVYRDYLSMTGACEANRASISWILRNGGPGNAVCLILGGATEALDARPGSLKLHVGKKAFIRLAMEHKASIIPVFSFGENEIFEQIPNAVGSRWRRFQVWLMRFIGVAPITSHARGPLPYRSSINTVVGKPMEFPETSEPSAELVDECHRKYLSALEELFEQHKQTYGVAKDSKLQLIY